MTEYFPFVILLLLLLLAWKFGDWTYRKKYYPSILFAISVDFFISLLLYRHSLWRFYPAFMIPNHSFSDFFIAFTNVPLIVFAYLSKFPFEHGFKFKFLYILIWTITFSIVEKIFQNLHLITYHHGWNFRWSIIVWLFTFFGLAVHYKKPFLAWILCGSCTAFLVIYFHIPVTKLK